MSTRLLKPAKPQVEKPIKPRRKSGKISALGMIELLITQLRLSCNSLKSCIHLVEWNSVGVKETHYERVNYILIVFCKWNSVGVKETHYECQGDPL